MAATYAIKVEKDGANVIATYDLSVRVAGPELLSSFQLMVEGKNLITDFTPGQQRYNGATAYVLAKPENDAPVFFSISTSAGWTTNGQDVLRGGHDRDDATFQS